MRSLETYFMKPLLSVLIAIFSISTAFSDPITATIIFENFTEKTTISGVFFIKETNQRLEINSLEKFTITLPRKGKYQFGFYSKDVNASTYYPVRITERKNTVTIRLENNTADPEAVSINRSLSMKDISNFSIEQIEEGINNGTINFIVHGLLAINPEAIKIFKVDYGVGFISENCVVDPIAFKTATNTNKKIEAYLTLKFGEEWKNKLPALPFGL